MLIVYGAGHVAGPKIWMGYNEDASMLDLARRKARYTTEKYGIATKVMDVTAIASYQGIQDFCKGADLCSLEHSNAAPTTITNFDQINRVVIYRTVLNPGDGPCKVIGEACARILKTTLSPIQHRANTAGSDWYGAIKRAMQAGCKDAFLIEHGFHTHGPTRAMLSDPVIRQQLAVDEVDAMARYYGWQATGGDTVLQKGSKGPAVVAWQTYLKEWRPGIDLGLFGPNKDGIDGSFGDKVEAATNLFKTAVKLPADGKVDDLTWAAMVVALKSTANQAEVDRLTKALSDMSALLQSAQEVNAKLTGEVDSAKLTLKENAGYVRKLVEFAGKY